MFIRDSPVYDPGLSLLWGTCSRRPERAGGKDAAAFLIVASDCDL